VASRRPAPVLVSFPAPKGVAFPTDLIGAKPAPVKAPTGVEAFGCRPLAWEHLAAAEKTTRLRRTRTGVQGAEPPDGGLGVSPSGPDEGRERSDVVGAATWPGARLTPSRPSCNVRPLAGHEPPTRSDAHRGRIHRVLPPHARRGRRACIQPPLAHRWQKERRAGPPETKGLLPFSASQRRTPGRSLSSPEEGGERCSPARSSGCGRWR